ncbi:YlmH family RNA-binding protein [Alicyclobacillus acidiphilus]|uniref:YlmH family RNA-binding protein n=1 Tax=Alicyclobacillus acidiphilus TaxID=182455 RepID=UPI00083160D1|nr:YlmH/Sll1252 family protein [Alicyclobacillus acidiphilus]
MSSESWVREQERPFLRSVQDWTGQVHARGRWYLTDFLTPREQFIATSAARAEGLVVAASGGYPHAERQRMLMMPDDWQPSIEDFQLTCLSIEAIDGEIRHKDVLGTLLGMGIQRKTLGDVIIESRGRAYVFLTANMGAFVSGNFHRAGRTTVSVTTLDPADVPSLPAPVYEDATIFVASLRVDSVIAQACHFSRGRAQEEVEKGNVTLNFADASQRDEVAKGDIISVRGFGRVKILELLGASKSQRIRLRVGILRSNA